MNKHDEIHRAKIELTSAKKEGRDPSRAQDRLRELYRIPIRKTKRAKISIA